MQFQEPSFQLGQLSFARFEYRDDLLVFAELALIDIKRDRSTHQISTSDYSILHEFANHFPRFFDAGKSR